MIQTFRTFVRDSRNFGPKIAWLNFRFNLGYRIGGFKSANRNQEWLFYGADSSTNSDNLHWKWTNTTPTNPPLASDDL